MPAFAQEEPLAEPEFTIPEPEALAPEEDITAPAPETVEPEDGGYDPAKLPPEESEEDFVIEAVNPEIIAEEYRRQEVPFDEPVEPGTIIVDPANRYLYHVLRAGTRHALRRRRRQAGLRMVGQRNRRDEAALAALGAAA